MNTHGFDIFIRSVVAEQSRRGLLLGIATAVVGMASTQLDVRAGATSRRRKQKKRRRRKRRQRRQRPELNAFGCVDIGKRCFGRDNLCCSGICDGAPPKQGESDTRTCVAHDSGGCQGGERPEGCGGVDVDCTTTGGLPGACNTTTGNAGFCGASGDCFPCAKDADCLPLCGAGAACVVCAESCSGTGGTACLGPSICQGF